MSKPNEIVLIVLIKTAILAMIETIAGCGIPGLRKIRSEENPTDLYATWYLACAIEVTLEVNARLTDEIGVYKLQFRLNWPSTGSTISGAIACSDLYMKVAHLAALLDAQWGGKRLYLKSPVETMAKPDEVSQLNEGALRCVVIPDTFPNDGEIVVGKARGRGLAARLPLSVFENGVLGPVTDCPMYSVLNVASGARVMVERTPGVWTKAVVTA